MNVQNLLEGTKASRNDEFFLVVISRKKYKQTKKHKYFFYFLETVSQRAYLPKRDHNGSKNKIRDKILSACDKANKVQ